MDDHALMLAALGRALRGIEGLEIVGEARAAREVPARIRSSRPDVVLLDVSMPDDDGLACLAAIRHEFPGVAVVMVSASTDPALVDRAAAAGARGYVAKTSTPAQLADAVHAAVSRDEFVTCGLERTPEPGVEGLTGRESTVFEGLLRGLSNRELAAALWVSEQTVKFHLRNIYRKLRVSGRAEAIHLFRAAATDRRRIATGRDEGPWEPAGAGIGAPDSAVARSQASASECAATTRTTTPTPPATRSASSVVR